MNVLLLGNGFDIYHYLPTKYHDFLLTVDFLIESDTNQFKTVADIFGNKDLCNKDAFIKACYEKHKETYEKTEVDGQKLQEIVGLCRDNVWFLYLLKSYNKDVGWIDFEKEIAFVIECFMQFFEADTVLFSLAFQVPDIARRYVMKEFAFFFEEKTGSNLSNFLHQIKNEFTLEYPLGSNNFIVNKDKIIEKLLKELEELANALRIYLTCFVEVTLEAIKGESGFNRCPVVSHIDKAITFNYTNTYEKLYFNKSAFHIHGDVNEQIVLGVNPDEFDEIEEMNISFVHFKKYFQRASFGTDIDYIEWLKEAVEERNEISLVIMGHSLDVTDGDMIKELLELAEEITIFYHNDEAKNDYIGNLIKLFGKSKFDEMRKNKRFRLLPLDMDFTEYIQERSDRSYEMLINSISDLV